MVFAELKYASPDLAVSLVGADAEIVVSKLTHPPVVPLYTLNTLSVLSYHNWPVNTVPAIGAEILAKFSNRCMSFLAISSP